MILLRDYQSSLKNKVQDAWHAYRALLAVLPTGGGKTVVFSSIIHDHNGAAAAVVHRKEILSQISCSLAQLDVKHRVIAPPETVTMIRRKHLKKFGKSYIDPHVKCGVISVQTLTSKSSLKDAQLQRWIKQLTLCVFDEGHHYIKQGIWGKAVELVTNAKILGVTATPERADGNGLGVAAEGFYELLIEGPTTQWLIDQGYLARFVYKAPRTDLNMDNLPVTANGDINTRVLRKRTVESHLVGDVIKHYLDHAAGKQAIAFASDVETANEIAEGFNANGVIACALSGKTDQRERDQKIDDFENRRITILVNVDLFDEGFDVPGVECVIMARPTLSLSKYLQMVGRALRPQYAPGPLTIREERLRAIAAGPKPNAIIIDPVRNWERHGMPNWPRKWLLASRESGVRSKSSDLIQQRICNACTQPYEAFYKICPYCGEPAPLPGGRSLPQQVEGDLIELDADGMAALFEKVRRANMSDEEYERDQLARHIPPVGRPADMKRFKAAKHRRGILKELMAWWFGMQPLDRSLSEKQRRFYHRFGVDVGTAMTLKADETDALIDLIKNRFTEDLRHE